jgi:uncharacterized protein YigE (DUF2233 family)
MKPNRIIIIFILFVIPVKHAVAQKPQIDDNLYVNYIVSPQKQAFKLYWRDDKLANFGRLQNLQQWLAKNRQKLLFAMNGGMYKPDGLPQGLFIENGKELAVLDTTSGAGNFYLKPNGVFYLTTDNRFVVCKTSKYKNNGKIKYATQSGPMLIIDGQIHPAFKAGSTNVNIRNGVGILPDGRVIFAMSKTAVNFYDFANYFKSLDCKNALYLDGVVSRTYLPERNWIQTDGDFGVIIGITEMMK